MPQLLGIRIATAFRMRVLITSSRMPFALDEIRKLGKEGHHVVASDTFRTAPGSHSRYAESWTVTASPRFARDQFIRDIRDIVRAERIDLVVPAFEEAFYLAWHLDELAPDTEVFVPPFSTLATLHNKATLLDLARSLSIRTPRTTLVDSSEALKRALKDFDGYFGRAAFSRGGVQLLTNRGPLAGELDIDECKPTPANPWLIQEFVDGEDICTFSIAHHGRIRAHATYVHPRELEHAGGIVFESIVDDSSYAAATALVEATAYHGQVSFDFKRTGDDVVLIECNPRPTAGVFVMSPKVFTDALFDRPGETQIAPAGVRHKYSVALIRDMVLHWREIPEDLKYLLSSAKEVYGERGDLAPALYQLLSYSHVVAYKRRKPRRERKRTDLAAAYFDDILWNGERLDEVSAA